MKLNPGRLCAFFIALILSQAAKATIIFDGGAETGSATSASSWAAGSAGIAQDAFAFNNIKWSGCATKSVHSSAVSPPGTSGVHVVTSPVRTGNYAYAMTIKWECDYTVDNGGSLQKPRVQLKIPSDIDSRFRIPENTERWLSMSFFVPAETIADTIYNEDVVFQLYKSQLGNPTGRNSTYQGNSPTVADGMIDRGNFVIRVADINGVESNPTNTTVFTEPVTYNAWYDVAIQFKPCRLVTSGCGTNGANGKLKIWVSSPTRRAASAPNDEMTPVYNHTGANTRGTIHDLSIDLYKFNWHCKSNSTGTGRNTSISDARADYSFCTSKDAQYGWTPTNQKTPRVVYYDNMKMADEATTSPTDLISNFSSDGPIGVTEAITRVNLDQDIPANKNPMYFNLDGFGGAGQPMGGTSASITSDTNGNSENVLALNTRSDGGRAVVSDLSTLARGTGTFTLNYDNTNLIYDSEASSPAMSSWTAGASATRTAYATTPLEDFGYTKGTTIQNGAASFGYIQSPSFTLNQDDIVTVRMTVKSGVGNKFSFRLRDTTASNSKIYLGTLGSISTTPTQNDHGTLISMSQYTDPDGRYHIEWKEKATTAGANSYYVGLGVGTNVSGNNVNVLGARIWVNESPVSITYPITIDLPDTTAPVLSECDITKLTSTSASAACRTDTSEGTSFVILADGDNKPSVPQIQAGLDGLGNAALAFKSRIVTGPNITETFELLDPLKDKYCFIQQQDLSTPPNDSIVYDCDTFIAGDSAPVTTKKIAFRFGSENDTSLMCRSASAGQSAPYNSADVGSGDIFIVIGSGNPRPSPGGQFPTILAYDTNATIVNGEYDLDETKLEYGSINALETGEQGYYMWGSNASGSCRWSAPVQVIEE